MTAAVLAAQLGLLGAAQLGLVGAAQHGLVGAAQHELVPKLELQVEQGEQVPAYMVWASTQA